MNPKNDIRTNRKPRVFKSCGGAKKNNKNGIEPVSTQRRPPIITITREIMTSNLLSLFSARNNRFGVKNIRPFIKGDLNSLLVRSAAFIV